MFHNVSFNFATAILKFDTFSSYHIIRTQIAKETASFSLFALLESVCTKKVPYTIHYSLHIYPKLIILWSVTDWQTDWRTKFFTPCSLSSFFVLWARWALPAGTTLLGWQSCGVNGRLECPRFPNLRAASLWVCDFFAFFSCRLTDLQICYLSLFVSQVWGGTSYEFASVGFWQGITETQKIGEDRG